MEKDFINVSIPASLYKKIEEKIKESEGTTVEDYIAKILRENLSKEESSQDTLSKEDEEKVKQAMDAVAGQGKAP